MPFGPEVADAYIEVHADTDAFRRELRTKMAREFRRFASQANKTFKKDLDLNTMANLEGFRRSLADAVNSGDWSKMRRQLGNSGRWVDDFREKFDALKDVMVDVVDEQGNVSKRPLFESDDVDRVNASLEKYLALLKSDEDIQALRKRTEAWIEQEQASKKATASLRKDMKDLTDYFERENERVDRVRDQDYSRAREHFDRMGRLRETALKEMEREFERRRRLAEKEEQDAERRRIRTEREAKRLQRLAEKEEEDLIRRRRGLFGRMVGARNDFVNFIGRLFAPLERGVARVVDNVITNIIKKLDIDPDSKLGQRFQMIAIGMGNALTAIIPTVLALGAALAIISPFFAGIVAGLSSLIGLFVSLASVVGLAVSALVPLAGIAAAGALGLGALVGVFQDMDRYAPGAAAAVKKISDAWSDNFLEGFAEKVAIPLRDMLDTVDNILRDPALSAGLGEAFAQVINAIHDLLHSPAWNAFQTALSTTYARAFGAFGTGLTYVIEALLTILAAAGPAAERLAGAFASWADGFAAEMERLAANGQLQAFFDLAVDALTSLSELGWESLAALFDLMIIAAPFGIEILDALTDIVKRFREWMGTKEGREELERWFESAKELAGTLKDVIGQVAEALNRMDTPENRKFFLEMLTAIGNIITGFLDLMTSIAEFEQGIANASLGVEKFIKKWTSGETWSSIGTSIIEGIKTGIETAWNWLIDSVTGWVDDLISAWNTPLQIASPSKVFAKMGAAIVEGLLLGITGAWGAFISKVTGLFGEVKTEAERVWSDISKSAKVKWNEIRTNVETVVNTLKTNIGTAWDNIKRAASTAWDTIKTTVTGKANEIRTSVQGTWNRITSEVGPAWAQVEKTLRTTWSNIKTTVSTKVEEVITVVRSIPGKASSAIGDLGGTLRKAGSKLIGGLIAGIRDRIGEVQALLANLTSKIPKWKGPESTDRRLLYSPGQMIMDGFIRGLRSRFGLAESTLKTFTKGLADLGGDALGGLGESSLYRGSVRTVNVQPGAIQVMSRAENPRTVAGMVLDDLAVRMVGV